MRRIIVPLVVLAVLAGGFFAARKYLPAVRPAFGPPPEDITKYLPEDSVPPQAPLLAENETNVPLKLPPGFRISIFAKDLPGARVMRHDRFGNLWVSRTSEGAVSLLEIDGKTGQVRNQSDVFTGLRKPHGLAFDPADGLTLYIAEEHRVRRFATYAEDPGTELLSLPAGDGHFTRTIAFGPDGQLYISVGSSCNVCIESDERRASILRYDPASAQATVGRPVAQFEIFARGLRNAVFFTWDYIRSTMWATEMGRDWLGDDLPPDEIDVIEAGGDYGWPICYGKNVHDTDFDKNVYVRDPCADKKPSLINIPAHSAPLGLAFIPAAPTLSGRAAPNSVGRAEAHSTDSASSPQASSGQGWPEDYWYDLLVAYHGSWNRSSPTGYKVVRHKFDAEGRYEGVEDFITGWLTSSGALGRPVDILVQPGGIVYLSDDKAGVIYKIAWQGSG